MDRRTLVVLALAVFAVLAIGLVAGTLTSTVDPGSGGAGGEETGESESSGNGDSPDGNTVEEGGSDGSDLPAFTSRVPLIIGVLVVAGTVAYMLFSPRSAARRFGVLTVIIATAVIAGSLITLSGQEPPPEPPLNGTNLTAPGDGGGTGEGTGGGTAGSLSGQLLVPVAGVVGALLLVALVLIRRSRRGTDDIVEPEDPDTQADTEALGEIAGRAADRIERAADDEATDNEVYRAWQEMTAQLDIENAESTTPREFQARAVDAGMTPDDVGELTRLFERVRYGGQSATADREQRAVSVLRRIESTYGEQS